MEKKQNLLLVEDDPDIRELLVFNFEREGYNIKEAEDGQRALDIIHQHKIDLILLGLMLPIIDGLSLCKILARENNQIPIIILTAKGEDVDKILGFELGATDYVVKPFNTRELILRVQARLKHTAQKSESEVDKLQIDTITLDLEAHTLNIDNQNISITFTEFRLLEELMKHAGHVRTREQLLNSVWGYEFEGYGRTVDTHIRRLRSKMLTKADNIDTVRGIGYKFKNMSI